MLNLKNIMLIKTAFLFVIFCNSVVDISHKILLQNIAFKVFDGSEQIVWISIINLLILLPYVVLFSASGFLSDRFNKRDILIYGALSSFILSLIMVGAYLSGNFYFAMITLTLLAVQSAVYSPAKYGIIIDLYGKENIALGNSALQAVTIIAILFAMAVTSLVFESYYSFHSLDTITTKEGLLDAVLPLTLYIVPVAFLELFISFSVLKNINSIKGNSSLVLDKKELFSGRLLKKNLHLIFSNNIIFLSILGLSVFWAVSQGMVVVFPAFAKEYLDITSTAVINGVIAVSGIGIALGSYIYSKLSRHYIEVGTIPIGAVGMAITIYSVTLAQSSFTLGVCFFFFGVFGGLFIVPLNSLIQFNARKKRLGTVLAGNNWFQSLFMFGMLVFTTVIAFNSFDSLTLIYIILIFTLFGTLYTIYKLPKSMILIFLKFAIGLKYKLEVDGLKNIPSKGGVLLLGNHISWLDWAIVLMSIPREVRFVMDKEIYVKWYINWLLKIFNVIPISNESSKSAMKAVATELDAGNIVVLFPEGSITRNGHLGEFKRGFEKILELTNSDVKVVPFYIRGLWESMFSRANKHFKKSYNLNNITIVYSKPIQKDNANVVSVKNEVIKLSAKAWEEHIKNLGTLSEAIFDRMKREKGKLVFADSTGVELSGTKFLTVSILFKSLLNSRVKGKNVGLLIPTTAAGAFVNYSVIMMGKTAVNLNYTSSVESIKGAVISSKIETIITSKKFIEKLKLKGIDIKEVLDLADIIYLEDLKPLISKVKAIVTLLSIKLFPSILLKAIHLKKIKKDDTVLIMFSSGSEGTPKGIMLSSDNVLGNTQQCASILNISHNDTILGSLPLFHAFGITVTTFLPLVEGIRCVAHPDPTDSLAIGELVSKYKATMMFGTSTFFRLYTKSPKLIPLMFQSLRLIIAGAEKLRLDVREEFKKKFGKDILEGYGVTETTPVACCNLPDILTPELTVQKGNKVGSVGLPIPGTTIKIVDPDSYEELDTDEEGMILISGIQVMKGYLNNQEKTDEVLKELDGKVYYVTGDKGKVDRDGFLTIVDRYSRFAKLGGEMVGLGVIEELLSKLIISQSQEVDYIVTAIEDSKKGERIVLLISGVDQIFVDNLKVEVLKSFDNKLMIPSVIKIVQTIPKLGSGKKDFKGAKKLAESLV